jgi:hypothetical protein
VPAGDDQFAELALECRNLGALYDHAAAQDANGGIDLGLADHRASGWNGGLVCRHGGSSWGTHSYRCGSL